VAHFTCKTCGEFENTDQWDKAAGERLLAAQQCHACNYWQGLIDLKDDPRSVRVGGQQYIVGPEKERVKGFYGSTWTIQFKDGRRVVTNNLWHRGRIPSRFQPALPDNAIFTGERPS
jgi:hypothetical protein